MTVEEALQRLWLEADRSSQSRVARAVGVYPSAVTRWKAGHIPEGENREKLLAWAEGLPPLAKPPETVELPHTIEAVVRQGQRELVDWAAEFAARVLEASAARVRELPAWVTEEELAEDDRLMDQLEAASEKAKAAKKKGRRASA